MTAFNPTEVCCFTRDIGVRMDHRPDGKVAGRARLTSASGEAGADRPVPSQTGHEPSGLAMFFPIPSRFALR